MSNENKFPLKNHCQKKKRKTTKVPADQAHTTLTPLVAAKYNRFLGGGFPVQLGKHIPEYDQGQVLCRDLDFLNAFVPRRGLWRDRGLCSRPSTCRVTITVWCGNNDPPKVTVWSETDSNASTLHSAADQNAG